MCSLCIFVYALARISMAKNVREDFHGACEQQRDGVYRKRLAAMANTFSFFFFGGETPAE